MRTDTSAVGLGKESERLATSEARLSSTNANLIHHVKVQGQHMEKLGRENRRLDSQCECFAAFVRSLPDDVRAETLLAFDYPVHLQAALNEHGTRNGKLSTLTLANMSDDENEAEDTSSIYSSSPEKKNSNVEDEGNRTPSPVKQRAENSLKGGEELSIEEAIEESKEQDQEHHLLQSQKGLQPQLLEEDKPPASANSAKRDLSGSDDSDAGDGKPDLQRRKGEHVAVTRPKATRSIKWSAARESSRKEDLNLLQWRLHLVWQWS